MAKVDDCNPVAEMYRELLQYAESHQADLDRYGEGRFLNQFERQVADELGMEAAVFLPSGVMAQLVAIQVWASERGLNRFACHETCHLIRHEEDAYKELLSLEAVLVGTDGKLPVLADLAVLARQPVSSLVYELPMRHLGGDLPDWEAWSAIKNFCREQQIRLHIDGARLFETEPYYGRTVKEIVAGADSLFLSFYKGFASTSGSMLLGSKRFVEEAKVWIRRFGGNLFQLYMLAIPARMNFEKRRHSFAPLVEKARSVGAALHRDLGLTVQPIPVKTNMFHVLIPGSADQLTPRIKAARTPGFNASAWPDYSPSGYCRCEFTVGEATLQLADRELIEVFSKLLSERP
jgi:threonine aldolase